MHFADTRSVPCRMSHFIRSRQMLLAAFRHDEVEVKRCGIYVEMSDAVRHPLEQH